MADNQDQQQQPQSPAKSSPPPQDSTNNSSTKRKLDDDIELAKQKAQEVAARLVSNAAVYAANATVDPKRARVENTDSSSQPPPPSNLPYSMPPLAQTGQYNSLQGASKKIAIPNGKVGVIIGKGGEMIKSLQLQSGAKIQITRDVDADPYSLTRDVELMGTSEQISRAEQLINDVIAETDAGGSASAAVHAPNAAQPGAEQVVVKVPNNKVALLIGKSGDTIKAIQSRSGARVQVIPLHLPPGDTSTERNVYINGVKDQIESAKELINEVLSGKRIVNPSAPGSYMQPGYPTPGSWAPQGQSPIQPTQYAYQQPAAYSTPSSYYGSYPTQAAGWDPSNTTAMPQPPQQTTGYAYYGQQAQTGSTAPNSSYAYSQPPPVASYGYDQNYSQQPGNYAQNSSSQTTQLDQQNSYASSGYGQGATPSQIDGAASSQSTQQPSAYPPTYSQPMANPQAGYWGSQNYSAGYDQSGYSQTAYGGVQPTPGLPPAGQQVHGQGGYPPQPAPAMSSYAQTPSSLAYGQPQVQQPSQTQPPLSSGYQQPSTYGTEQPGNENTGASNGSASVPQETVH